MQNETISNRYQVSKEKYDGICVIDTFQEDDGEKPIVEVETETKARIIVELLNQKEDLINEKPLDLHIDFTIYDNLIIKMNNNARELFKKEKEQQLQADKLLAEAAELKEKTGEDIIKKQYGGNNDGTRKRYVEEHTQDLQAEFQELKFLKEENARELGFIKRLIDMKTELIKYGDGK